MATISCRSACAGASAATGVLRSLTTTSRYSARRTPRVVEDRVESVRVRDVTTDAITVLRLDVMIREITVQTVEIKMENPRMDAKK